MKTTTDLRPDETAPSGTPTYGNDAGLQTKPTLEELAERVTALEAVIVGMATEIRTGSIRLTGEEYGERDGVLDWAQLHLIGNLTDVDNGVLPELRVRRLAIVGPDGRERIVAEG